MDNKESGAGIVTMATEGGRTHTRDGTISRGVLTITTIWRKTVACDGGCDSCHLGLFVIFISNLVHSSGYITYNSAHGAVMLALLEALWHSPPRLQICIFFQDATFHTYFTPSSPPSLLLPVTRALEDYLTASPSSHIMGFWANLSWHWPGLQSWSDTTSFLHNNEFHATLLCVPTSDQ
jgi:hypothetical protein